MEGWSPVSVIQSLIHHAPTSTFLPSLNSPPPLPPPLSPSAPTIEHFNASIVMLMVLRIQNNFFFVPLCHSALIEEWYLSLSSCSSSLCTLTECDFDRVLSVSPSACIALILRVRLEGKEPRVLTGHVEREEEKRREHAFYIMSASNLSIHAG